MNSMKMLDGFASIAKAYREPTIKGSRYDNENCLVNYTYDTVKLESTFDSFIDIICDGFTNFTVDAIILDVGVEENILRDCYFSIILQYRKRNTGQEFREILWEYPLYLFRLLQMTTVIKNKLHFILPTKLFCCDKEFYGFKTFDSSYEQKIRFKIFSQQQVQHDSFKFIKYEIIARKITSMIHVAISNTKYKSITNVNQADFKTNGFYYGNTSLCTNGVKFNRINDMKGYFLSTSNELESISYKFYKESKLNNNIYPINNLQHKWMLTKKHITALYETLEEILPHEVIYIIEKFCTPEYLYWFPFEPFKKWNETKSYLASGELEIFTRDINNCKIYIMQTLKNLY